MWIKHIEPATEGHFENRRAVILYACGCNLRCPYCGYAEYLGRTNSEDCMDLEAVLTYLGKRLDRLDGIILSGGEPTINEDIEEWLGAIKKLGLSVMLETNGTQPETLRMLLQRDLIDYVAMDVKAPIENYAAVTGARMDWEQIRTSIWVIKHSGTAHEFRTTVVPGLHTTRELRSIAELVHGADKYVVQDFISTSPLRREYQGRPAFPKKPLEDLRKYAERRVKEFEVRHFDAAKPMPVLKRRMRQTIGVS